MARPKPALIDTGYVVALVNRADQWHRAAVRWREWIISTGRRLVTTEYVLVEIGNGLSGRRFRALAAQLIADLRRAEIVKIVPASKSLLDDALELYRGRPDKDWGLTDCASFVVMADLGLTDALTPDDHFRQAGFRPLLLDDPPA
jgi:uncharacterized protein